MLYLQCNQCKEWLEIWRQKEHRMYMHWTSPWIGFECYCWEIGLKIYYAKVWREWAFRLDAWMHWISSNMYIVCLIHIQRTFFQCIKNSLVGWFLLRNNLVIQKRGRCDGHLTWHLWCLSFLIWTRVIKGNWEGFMFDILFSCCENHPMNQSDLQGHDGK